MARAAAAGLIAALGSVGAFAVTSSPHDEPIPYGAAATVYRTVTETQDVRYQGHGVRWWAARAVRARREALAQGITLRRIRGALRRIRVSMHAQVHLGASGLEQAFLCIHGFEGSWSDPDAPYYGGVQMDTSFMAAYGAPFLRAFGPANNWTPAMQIVTAERAYLEGRGFGPWPQTSRMCGLR